MNPTPHPIRPRPAWLLLLAILPLALPALPGPSSGVPAPPSNAPSTPIPTTQPAVARQPTPAPTQDPKSKIQNLKSVDWFHFNDRTAPYWTLALNKVGDPTAFTLAPGPWASGLDRPRRIFILYSRNSSVFDLCLNAILDMYHTKNLPATFTVLNYFDDPEAGLTDLETAWAGHYDLIYAMGSDALLFMEKNFAYDTTPVVSVSNKDPVLLGLIKDYHTGSGTKYAYTSVNAPMDLELAYILQLKPDLQNIVIMYEQTNISAVQTQVEPMRALATAHNIHVIDVKVINKDRAKQELAAKVPFALAEIDQTDPTHQRSLYWITGSTTVFANIATINQYAANVPVLSIFPELVTPGDDSAVLSVGVGYGTNGTLAALYGIRILRGETTAGALPVGLVTPPDIAINFRKAQQIGLKIPFSFFESATTIYDYAGRPVRLAGQTVTP